MREISAEKKVIPIRRNQLAFDFQGQEIVSDETVQKRRKAEKEWFAEYAISEWLNKYFEVKLVAETTQSPSITSFLTDMPFYAQGGMQSKIESAVVKKVSAQEWINYFHEKLDKLPKIHQKIIKKKYLETTYDGKFVLDEVICGELHIGRTLYYRLKKEALYWLGLALYSSIGGDEGV